MVSAFALASAAGLTHGAVWMEAGEQYLGISEAHMIIVCGLCYDAMNKKKQKGLVLRTETRALDLANTSIRDNLSICILIDQHHSQELTE